MPAPSADTVTVTNLKVDTIRFHPVYETKDGKLPKDDKGKTVKPDAKLKAFTLELGSQLDKGVEKALQPVAEVPRWALEHYRRHPFFQKLIDEGHILVHVAA